ncbi:hypothetical protein Sjap_023770 [Stephania japonica]|uniref:Transcription factor MYB35 n=1 Tax=Stephania japonica TaxID=461633 RepID=A0AAP0EJI4_9MAGN
MTGILSHFLASRAWHGVVDEVHCLIGLYCLCKMDPGKTTRCRRGSKAATYAIAQRTPWIHFYHSCLYCEMGRPPCCDKSNVKKGLWTAEEDAKILAHVATHGTGNWTSVPRKAGLKRCGKSCRLRWTNYLRPDLKHDKFTPEEEELIVNLHATIGSRWSLIAGQLPGRTDNDVKNYWNTKLKKKLKEMGIDPVTHKPFSQILTAYANISGLPKVGGSLNRDLKNAFMLKSESTPALQDYTSNTEKHSTMTLNRTVPKLEPLVQDSHYNSLELLSQLQAINMVPTSARSFGNQMFFSTSEGSASSSSSNAVMQVNSQPLLPCPPISSPVQVTSSVPSSPFSWSEFLLEDCQPQEDFSGLSSSASSGFNRDDKVTQKEFLNNEVNVNDLHGVVLGDMGYSTHDTGFTGKCYQAMSHGVEASNRALSPSGNSFMEVMMDQDNELTWEFSGLLEDFY